MQTEWEEMLKLESAFWGMDKLTLYTEREVMALAIGYQVFRRSKHDSTHFFVCFDPFFSKGKLFFKKYAYDWFWFDIKSLVNLYFLISFPLIANLFDSFHAFGLFEYHLETSENFHD